MTPKWGGYMASTPALDLTTLFEMVCVFISEKGQAMQPLAQCIPQTLNASKLIWGGGGKMAGILFFMHGGVQESLRPHFHLLFPSFFSLEMWK